MAIIEDKAPCDAEAVKAVTHKIDLTLTEFGHGKVTIDGMDMSDAVSTTLRLDNDPDTGPVLTVQILGDFEAHAEGRVRIDDEAAKALEALGWTPPADHEHVWTSRLCDNRESCHCGETREMATPEADDD